VAPRRSSHEPHAREAGQPQLTALPARNSSREAALASERAQASPLPRPSHAGTLRLS